MSMSSGDAPAPVVSHAVPFDAVWQLDGGEDCNISDDDNDMELPFSLSFSRDEEDGFLSTLVQEQDVYQPDELTPFSIESSSHLHHHHHHSFDDMLSPDDDDDDDDLSSSSSSTALAFTPGQGSRKRKIVTPQQRKRQRQVSTEDRQGRTTGDKDNNATSSFTGSITSRRRMLSCMQRSEATRLEILAHFPSEEQHPVAQKRQSIQHCFLHTQTSRERLLSYFG